MSNRFPNLNALRVFEVAARHMSFTKAGAELNMSQAAVSQRIKMLEEHLGQQLFHRQNRRLFLTEIAENYLPVVREALGRLDLATEQLFPRLGRRLLRLMATPSFSTLWLAPRMAEFNRIQPDIDIRLTGVKDITYSTPDLSMDAEIRYGDGKWKGLRVDKLADVEIMPVCSPRLVPFLRRPSDIGSHPLIHVIGYEEDWLTWLTATGVSGIDPARGIQLDSSTAALQAAQVGGGVALARMPLARELIEDGSLAEPFPEHRLAVERGYYLVSPSHTADQPDVKMFREWILQQFRNGIGKPKT